MKKIIFLSLSLTMLYLPLKPMMEQTKDKFMTAMPLVLSGAVIYGLEKVQEQPLIKSFHRNTGYSAGDIKGIIGLSAALYTFGKLFNKPELADFGARTPLAALVGGLSTTKTVADITKKIPLVGSYFECSNTNCQGVCQDCRLRGIVRAIGFYSLTNYGLIAFQNWRQAQGQ